MCVQVDGSVAALHAIAEIDTLASCDFIVVRRKETDADIDASTETQIQAQTKNQRDTDRRIETERHIDKCAYSLILPHASAAGSKLAYCVWSLLSLILSLTRACICAHTLEQGRLDSAISRLALMLLSARRGPRPFVSLDKPWAQPPFALIN